MPEAADRLTSPEPTCLPAALEYAARGWPVLPLHGIRLDGTCTCGRPDCSSPGKHPHTRRGVKDATTCPETIREWWSRWPAANIGVATGGALMVLDVDGPEGERSLSGRHLPVTPSVATGNGGHVYLLPPEGVTIGNATRFLPGLDVRGEGGYVVAPPSRHCAGVDYAWQIALEEEELAPCPEWLADPCARKPRATAAAPAEHIGGAIITEPGRNVALTSMAGRWRQAGLERRELTVALLSYNREHCEPPLPEGEVWGIGRSVSGYARGPVRIDRRLLTAGLSDGALLLAAVLATGAPETELSGTLRVTDRSLRSWWAELREAGLEEVARATPTRRFVTVPRGLLLDPEVPRAAKVTSLHLASYEHNGRMKVSQEQVGRKRDRDPREIKRDLRALREAGYLCSSGPAAFCAAKGRRQGVNRYWWPEAELRNVASEARRECPQEAPEAKPVSPRPHTEAELVHHDPITTETTESEEEAGGEGPLPLPESVSPTRAIHAVDVPESVPARADDLTPAPVNVRALADLHQHFIAAVDEGDDDKARRLWNLMLTHRCEPGHHLKERAATENNRGARPPDIEALSRRLNARLAAKGEVGAR